MKKQRATYNPTRFLYRNSFEHLFFGYIDALLVLSKTINQPVTLEQAILGFRERYGLSEEDFSFEMLRRKYYHMISELRDLKKSA